MYRKTTKSCPLPVPLFSLGLALRPGRVMLLMCVSVFFCLSVCSLNHNLALHINFWIMGELLNYGWSFEIWVNFWIMGEYLNCGWPFEIWVNFLNYECGTNIIYLDKWISEYISYHSYWTNEYLNIFCIIIGSIWSRMNIFVQIICIYSNIWLFAQDCFGLFWPFSYFVLFWAHIKPF